MLFYLLFLLLIERLLSDFYLWSFLEVGCRWYLDPVFWGKSLAKKSDQAEGMVEPEEGSSPDFPCSLGKDTGTQNINFGSWNLPESSSKPKLLFDI